MKPEVLQTINRGYENILDVPSPKDTIVVWEKNTGGGGRQRTLPIYCFKLEMMYRLKIFNLPVLGTDDSIEDWMEHYSLWMTPLLALAEVVHESLTIKRKDENGQDLFFKKGQI